MTAITVLLSVLVFVGLVGGSFMTCGPARQIESEEEATTCPMRRYVIAYFTAAGLLAVALLGVAWG